MPDDFVDLIATAALDAAAHRAARRHRWVRIVGAMIRGLLVLLLLAVIVVTFAYW
jgi:type VI protein secretion system component VasK